MINIQNNAEGKINRKSKVNTTCVFSPKISVQIHIDNKKPIIEGRFRKISILKLFDVSLRVLNFNRYCLVLSVILKTRHISYKILNIPHDFIFVIFYLSW